MPWTRRVSSVRILFSSFSSQSTAAGQLRWPSRARQHRCVLIAPRLPFSARPFATGVGAPPPDFSRPRRRPRHPVPAEDDLPMILTAAGMVKVCSLPENRGSPLVGLDVAPSNFGVAISDETRTFAFPLTRVPRRESTKKLDPSIVLGKLREMVKDSSACGLVVGWPLTRSGRAEGQCLMVLQFLRQVHLKGQVDVPVTLFDERLTSAEARSILKDEGVGRKAAKREDETAAMVILQGFLDTAEAEHGGLSSLPTKPSSGDR